MKQSAVARPDDEIVDLVETDEPKISLPDDLVTPGFVREWAAIMDEVSDG